MHVPHPLRSGLREGGVNASDDLPRVHTSPALLRSRRERAETGRRVERTLRQVA